MRVGIPSGILLAAALSLAGCTAPQTSTSHSSGGASTSTAVPASEAVRDGTMEFVVKGVKRAQTVGNPADSSASAKAQGEFIIIDMTVRNISNDVQTYFTGNQKLIAGGKHYGDSIDAELYLPNSELTSQINPGSMIDTAVAFDVPPGTVADALEVHDFAFSPGATVPIRH